MDVTEIKKLMMILEETDVTEINLESDGTKVSLKKDLFVKKKIVPDVNQIVAQSKVEVKKPEEEEEVCFLISMNVGRFYYIKNGNPMIKIGQEVIEGQVVGYIESVGVKTDVKSDRPGIIKEILVENGGRAEFGKQLMLLAIK